MEYRVWYSQPDSEIVPEWYYRGYLLILGGMILRPGPYIEHYSQGQSQYSLDSQRYRPYRYLFH